MYDVTKFLEDHPGGPEILHNVAGQECTTNFEEVFHSQKARKMMAKYVVGRLEGSTVPDGAELKQGQTGGGESGPGGNNSAIIAAVVVLMALLYYLFAS